MIINFRLFEAKNILPDYNDYIIISSEYLELTMKRYNKFINQHKLFEL